MALFISKVQVVAKVSALFVNLQYNIDSSFKMVYSHHNDDNGK